MAVDPTQIPTTVVEKSESVVDPIRDHEGRIVRNEEQLKKHTEDVQREMFALEERLAKAIAEGNQSAIEGISSRLEALENKLSDALVKLEEVKPVKAAEDVVATPTTVVEPVERQEAPTPKKEEKRHGHIGRKEARREFMRSRREAKSK